MRLCALRQTMSILESCIETCRFFNAPVRKLPDDILMHIFEMSCPAPFEIPLGNMVSNYSTDPRHILTGVCHRWRNLALGTPILWNNVTISCGAEPRSQSLAEHQLGFLKAVVLRSKLCPLQIHLVPFGGNYKIAGKEIVQPDLRSSFWNGVFDFLEPQLASRCLSITFSRGLIPFNSSQNAWLLLKTLRIEVALAGQNSFPAALPALQTVQLDVCPSKLNLGIAWHTLTRIEARNWDIQELYRVLRQSINLEELWTSGIEEGEKDESIGLSSSISLPFLRNIRMHTGIVPETQRNSSVLWPFHMPSLQSLRLDFTDSDCFQPFLRKLTEKLDQSPIPLTSLIVTISAIHLSELPSLLRVCSSVETFHLNITYGLGDSNTHEGNNPLANCQAFVSMFRQMTPETEEAKSNSILLPRLNELALRLFPDQSCDTNNKEPCMALVDMSRSRSDPRGDENLIK